MLNEEVKGRDDRIRTIEIEYQVVCPSVRLSAHSLVTHLSQNWFISFFSGFVHQVR